MVDEITATLKIKLNKDTPLTDWQIDQFLKHLVGKLSGTQFTRRFLRYHQLDPLLFVQEIKITRRKKKSG